MLQLALGLRATHGQVEDRDIAHLQGKGRSAAGHSAASSWVEVHAQGQTCSSDEARAQIMPAEGSDTRHTTHRKRRSCNAIVGKALDSQM